MKKVLIIGHFWPYRSGGSKRMIGLAKRLPEFGWKPIILTGPLHRKPDSQFKVVEAFCTDVFENWRKILFFLGLKSDKNVSREVKKKLKLASRNSFIDFFISSYLTIFAYPDAFKSWKVPAIKAGEEIIKKEKVDAIISVWPQISHIIAKKLKEKYEQVSFGGQKKISWIADFPELWSRNCDYSYGFLRKIIDRRLEIKTLSSANAFIVLSQYDKETQEKIHKGKEIYVIPHGFELDDINIPPTKLTAKFTITYAGTLYAGKRDPSKFLKPLKELISEGFINPEKIEVRFYGPREEWLNKEIEKYGLSEIVKQYGFFPREIILERERDSQVLLLLKWEDLKEKGVYSGKIFEYLATRRPILATGGGQDVVSDLLNETKAGIDAINLKEVKDAIKKLYSEYIQKGEVFYYGDIEKINKYSSKEMAKKFADVLNEQIL